MPQMVLKPQHEKDPREEILGKVGDLSDFKLFHNKVLVGVYIRPNKTMLGGKPFHLADKTVGEDEFQGTVGLVLAKGPAAFRDDPGKTFYGCDAQIGDWVFFRAADGPKIMVKGVLCRRIEDIFVEGVIPHPDYVY